MAVTLKASKTTKVNVYNCFFMAISGKAKSFVEIACVKKIIILPKQKAQSHSFQHFFFKAPEEFELTAKDGKTTIYGALWNPSNYDPSKSYPIIDATYSGPHTQLFPKSFSGIFG